MVEHQPARRRPQHRVLKQTARNMYCHVPGHVSAAVCEESVVSAGRAVVQPQRLKLIPCRDGMMAALESMGAMCLCFLVTVPLP